MRRSLVLIGLLVLTIMGCGSRLTDEEIRAAASGPSPGNTFAAGDRASTGPSPSRPTDPVAAAGERTPAAGTGPVRDDQRTAASAGPRPARAGTSGSPAPSRAGPRADAGLQGPPAPDDQGNVSPSGGMASTPAVAGGQRSPIVIGSVGTVSGPVGSTFIHQVNAVQVWSRMVNERGGLNGHAIKLITADDGGDPARHRALVQQLVERDHVIAFVANPEALTGHASVAYHQQVRVPVLGSEGGSQYFYESPMHFPQVAHGEMFLKAFLASTAQQALPEGKRKLATLVCREVSQCERADAVYGGGYAAELGFQLVYRGKASIAQPDFTAECLNAQSAGAEVFFLGLDANSVNRVATSCARQGYRPLLAWAANATNDDQPKISSTDGALVAALAFPWMVGDTPATAEFQAAMARYLPSVHPNGSHSVGWTAAKLFEKAMVDVSEPPTAADVLEGLWKIRDDDLGGLTYPLTFVREQPAAPRLCWFNVRVRDGKFVAPNGTNHSCRS